MTIASTPNTPTFAFDDLPLHWQMTRCEKFALRQLLTSAAPQVAIEIGTYRGGSLQNISQFAEKVYSLDIDPGCRENLGPLFSNVDFLTGDSVESIPKVLEEIKISNQELGFVLIDGDHSSEGVRRDAQALFEHIPTRDVYLVFHDSFNPDVRSGILSIDWNSCPYIHYVEVDFVPGVYHKLAFDTATPGSMWGGFAFAIMKPEIRKGSLEVHQSQRGLFDAVYLDSCYAERSNTPAKWQFWNRKKSA